MTISGRTIAKNAGVLMASQLITWGLSFLLTIFMSRYLGPDGIGQLQLGNALWTIVAVTATLGMDTLITKEIARAPDRLNKMVSTALALRVLIFLLGALGLAAYVRLAGYPALTVSVIWIIGICFLIGQPSGTFDAAFKGLERMEYTSLSSVVIAMLVSFLQIGLLLLGFGIIPIAAAGIISGTTGLAVQYSFLRKLTSIHLSFDWRLIRSVLQASLPYFLVSVGIVLYNQVDIVIISLLADEKTVGWYSVAARLYGTLLFIPSVFGTALFPALTRSYGDSRADSHKLAQKSLNLLVLVSVPIGLGILVVADQLIVLLFGTAFANSGPVLAVRGILLTLTYVNMLLGFLLISMDYQKVWGAVMLVATFATIPLDLLLVPWAVNTFENGALGGVFSYAFTEIGITVAGFCLLPEGTFCRVNVKVTVRVILAGLVMTWVTWIVRDAFILVPVAVGAVSYIGMIVLLRAIPKEDRVFISGMISSIFQHLRSRFFRAAELKG